MASNSPPRSRVWASAPPHVPDEIVRALARDYGVHPYSKWRGAHWRLASLVEIAPDDARAAARRAAEDVLGWLADPTSIPDGRGPCSALCQPGGSRALRVLSYRHGRRAPTPDDRRFARRNAVAGRRLELRPAPRGDAFVIQRDVGSDDGPGGVRARHGRRASSCCSGACRRVSARAPRLPIASHRRAGASCRDQASLSALLALRRPRRPHHVGAVGRSRRCPNVRRARPRRVEAARRRHVACRRQMVEATGLEGQQRRGRRLGRNGARTPDGAGIRGARRGKPASGWRPVRRDRTGSGRRDALGSSGWRCQARRRDRDDFVKRFEQSTAGRKRDRDGCVRATSSRHGSNRRVRNAARCQAP